MYLGNDGIKPAEAATLLRSGEWVRQEDLISEAVQKSAQLVNATPPGVQGKRNFEPFQNLLTTLRKDPWPFERRVVIEPDSRLDPKLFIRVGIGEILKIRQTLRSAITQALALILYSATTTNSGGYLYLGFILLGWPLVDTLKTAFETIDDPDELLVFEMVATISAEVRIVDAEALARENFAEAFGKCAPYLEDITARLAPKLSAHTVQKCLVALRSRQILVCVDERWRIAF